MPKEATLVVTVADSQGNKRQYARMPDGSLHPIDRRPRSKDGGEW